MADAELSILMTLKDEATSALNSMNGTLKGVGVAVAAMGVAAIGAGVASVTSFASTAESLDLLSQKTGFSAEALSTLQYELETNGSNLDSFATDAKKMATNISMPTQAIIDDFASMGLSITDLQAMTPEQQFNTIGLAIGNIQDPTLRAAEAVKLLGKSGSDMIPVFSQGQAGLDAMAASAQAAGVVMSTDTMKSGADLNKTIEDLEQSFKGVALEIGSGLAPAIKPLVTGFVTLVQALPIKEFATLISQLLPPLVSLLLELLKAIPVDVVIKFVEAGLGPMLTILTNPLYPHTVPVHHLLTVKLVWTLLLN